MRRSLLRRLHWWRLSSLLSSKGIGLGRCLTLPAVELRRYPAHGRVAAGMADARKTPPADVAFAAGLDGVRSGSVRSDQASLAEGWGGSLQCRTMMRGRR